MTGLIRADPDVAYVVMDLADRLRILSDLEPVLTAPDADFGHWEVTPPTGVVHHLGWFQFGPVADAFRDASPAVAG